MHTHICTKTRQIQTENVGTNLSSATHVLLHGEHAGGGLDVQAPGVEADALPHQRHL